MKVCPKCSNKHEKNGIFCNRKCANSRTWTEEDKKIKSDSLKEYFKNNDHSAKGKPGWKHSDEMKKRKREKTLEYYDKIGRLSKEHHIIKNRQGVALYRARKKDAIIESSDLNLISKIYKMCPSGYEVDHIIALAEGGLHHQDNLQYLPASENRKKNRTQNYNKDLIITWQSILIKELNL